MNKTKFKNFKYPQITQGERERKYFENAMMSRKYYSIIYIWWIFKVSFGITKKKKKQLRFWTAFV